MLPLRARSNDDAHPSAAAPPVEVFCHRPIYRSAAEVAFVASVRRAGAEVGVPVRVVSGGWCGRGAAPAGVFVSARLPTVVVAVGGRVMAQTVGRVSLAELRLLVERARRRAADP